MRNFVSRWLLILIVAVSFWWLLIDARPGVAPPKPIHITELRTLATFLPGRRPAAVTETVLAARSTPGDFYAPGSGLKLRPLAIIAWTLPVPGKGAIMIDPDAEAGAEAGVGQSSALRHAARDRIDRHAQSAGMILYTQGYQNELPRPADHLGKAGSSLTRAAASLQPISYTTAQALAAGVVIIPASSHAPGARLIFVQLGDGREFLFVGDLAPFDENWRLLRARSHLAAILGPAQDRSETYAWLRTIRQLKSEAPQLTIVPGHDYFWLHKQLASRIISHSPPLVISPPKAP